MVRCEGYTRIGGVFSFGPIKWIRCEKEAKVIIEGTQNKSDHTNKRGKFIYPACMECWETAMNTGHIKINKVTPIKHLAEKE